jgi:hypothetical protein
MRLYESLSLFGDVLCHKRYIEDVRITRISPRSFYAGKDQGFKVGLTIGWVAGIVTVCLFITLTCGS